MSKLIHYQQCRVTGALALTLRFCRWVGVAPLKFESVGKGYTASVSKPFFVYSIVVMLVLHSAIFSGFVISADPNNEIRSGTGTSFVIWILELLLVVATTTIAVCGGAMRMKRLIECLNIIDKVQSETIHRSAPTSSEFKQCAWAVFIIASANLHHIDYLMAFVINKVKEPRIIGIYLSFCIEFVILVSLELQLFFLGIKASAALASINDTLKNMLFIMDLQSKKQLPPESLSAVIDTMNIDTYFGRADSSTQSKEKLRRLIVCHSAVCDVVRQINRCYEKMMILFISSYILFLVVTPFYIATFLFTLAEQPQNFLQQLVSLILHIIYMFMGVEPGHRTDKEVARTQILVTELQQHVPSSQDSLSMELDLFYQQIDMTRPKYCPMGVCTVNRGLITSIFTTATTFIVVILQYQTKGQ